MEWNDAIDLSQRKFTSRLIVQQALARGWGVCGFKSNLAIFLLHIPGRDKPVQIFSASPPQMSYPASKIAKDKYITSQILASQNLPVPEELLIDLHDNVDREATADFLLRYQTVVVKPLDTSHGKGITVGVTNVEQLQAAIIEAGEHSNRGRALVQRQIAGIDVRIVCIDYEFVDAISRIPASVVGDGSSTTAQLIETTNNGPERGENYKAKLNYIPLDKARQFLGSDAMDVVPAGGEQTQVIGVSNTGMGGVLKNISAGIPEWLKVMACQATKTLELPICGIDFMVKTLPRLDSTIEELQPHIIEVNECPALSMHEDLQSPEQLAVIDSYLDFIAKA